MTHKGAPAWVRADEVKRAARRIGLDCLQRYLDHLTRTRAYGWFEVRTLTAAERTRLAELVGEKNRDQYEKFTTELMHWKVAPLTGDELAEYLSKSDLVALVKAMPFVRWYTGERRRLRRDAQLVANRTKQRESIAAVVLKRAQAAYVEAENYTSDGQLPDWQEDQRRRSRFAAADQIFSDAGAERRDAKRTSREAARIRSAADRLDGARPCDLALLGAALESFVCREFSNVLASVDSVAMVFFTWVDAETISCASPRCSERFLPTSTRRRRPQEYCSPACKMAACRAREESAQAA
jgi:hypothetical protein